MKLEKPVKLKKSFTLDAVKEIMEEGQLPTIHLSGYASRGFTDDGQVAIDLDGETINQYGIDVSRLATGNIPLLFQHDQSKIVGKVLDAAYDSKGLYVNALLTKLPGDSLTNYVYEAVKAGMLSSFSVGLMVDEIDYTEDDQIEIKKSKLFELSVVSTPALASATFTSTVIKSADGYSMKAVVDADALKADNADLCTTLGCLLKSAKKDKPVENQIKTKETDAIQSEVTPVEPEVTPEVVPPVEPEVVPAEPAVEAEPVVPAEGVEPVVPAKEVVPEVTPEVTPPKEVEAPSKTSEVPEVVPPAEPVPAEVTPEEVPLTLAKALDLLATVEIDKLSDDDLDKVFEIVSTINDAVEAKVVAEVAAAMFQKPSA